MLNSLQALVKRLKHEPTPLVDGSTVTFVWQGPEPPDLVGDFTDWHRGAEVELAPVGEEFWVYQTDFPAGSYVEYAYRTGEDDHPDRYNPRRVSNGMGKHNHYFYMPGGGPSDLAQGRNGVSRGHVSKHMLPTGHMIAGDERLVYLYHPPVAHPVPLLVVWDGRDYLKQGRLEHILDNLIAQGRIQPLAMALVDNGRTARTPEYACSDATLIFLFSSVIPLAMERLNLVDPDEQPGAWGVLGASMGGAMALYTGLRIPKVFGHVLSQSGAFSLDGYDLIVYDLVPALAPPRPRIWMDIGAFDMAGLPETNRRMLEHLQAHEYSVAYHEYPGGHNYTSWRNDLWRGLEYLYPGPASQTSTTID